MATETEDERGFVRQVCDKCGMHCDGSTIFKRNADAYDRRCPRCGHETMRTTAWVKWST